MNGLVAAVVVARTIGYIRNAGFFKCQYAGTSILNGFYLRLRRLALPKVNRVIVFHAFPVAGLTFFFLTRNSGHCYNGDDNGKYFHMTKIINARMICKSTYN